MRIQLSLVNGLILATFTRAQPNKSQLAQTGEACEGGRTEQVVYTVGPHSPAPPLQLIAFLGARLNLDVNRRSTRNNATKKDGQQWTTY